MLLKRAIVAPTVALFPQNYHRQRNVFQSWGGGQIFEVENGDQTVATQGMSEGGRAPSEAGAFLKM